MEGSLVALKSLVDGGVIVKVGISTRSPLDLPPLPLVPLIYYWDYTGSRQGANHGIR